MSANNLSTMFLPNSYTNQVEKDAAPQRVDFPPQLQSPNCLTAPPAPNSWIDSTAATAMSASMPTATSALALQDYVVLFHSKTLLPADRRSTHEFVDFLGQSAGITLALHDLSCDGAVDPSATYIAVGYAAAAAVGVNTTAHLAGLGKEGFIISARLAPPHVVVAGGVESASAFLHGDDFRCLWSPCASSPTGGGDRGAAACQYDVGKPKSRDVVVGQRGTMYALYQFLQLAGFRWYAHDCFKVPSIAPTTPLSSLLVASPADWPVDIRFVPPFLSRDVGYHCAFLSSDWARRNFLNGACCGPRVPAQEKAYDRFTVPWADDQVRVWYSIVLYSLRSCAVLLLPGVVLVRFHECGQRRCKWAVGCKWSAM